MHVRLLHQSKANNDGSSNKLRDLRQRLWGEACPVSRFLLFFSLLLMMGQTQAQLWFPMGAAWYYSQYTDTDPVHSCRLGYSYIRVEGDTLLKGKDARILISRSYALDYTPSYREEYVYAEGDSVFHYDIARDTFYVLYDFSAKPGDTLTLRPHSFHSHYFGLISASWFGVVIDSVGTIEIEGHIRRVQHTHFAGPDSFLPYTDWHYGYFTPVIEGIGSLWHLFGGPTSLPTGCFGGLRCYGDSSLFFRAPTWYRRCDYTINASLENGWGKYAFRLYPNPASSSVTLDFDQREVGQVKVYDLQGRLRLSQAFATKALELDLQGLHPGSYIVETHLKGEQPVRRMLLKRE